MNSDSMRQLRALNARFIHNYVTNDVKSHDSMMHERFICVTPMGEKVSREDYLKAWATGFDPGVIVYWDYRDEKISIFGAVALVRSTNRKVIRKDAVETVGMTTYTDIYLCENGEWKCIQAQITAVAPEHYPGDETIVRKYIMGQIQD
jgi:ketosteroid isomerase-like protein